jgi:hypothetical protein
MLHFQGRPNGTKSALASRLKPVWSSSHAAAMTKIKTPGRQSLSCAALGTRSDEGASVGGVREELALGAGAEHYHQYQIRRGG